MTTPGWYPDPQDGAVRRYWSGTEWGPPQRWDGRSWVADLPVASAAGPAYPPGSHPAAPYPAAAAPPIGPGAGLPRVPRRLWVAAAGAALVVLGCLLPWASQNNGFSTQTISGTDANGGVLDLVLGLVLLGLLAVVVRGRAGAKALWGALVVGAVIVVVCVANMSNLADVIDQEQASGVSDVLGTDTGTKVGVGIVLVLVGGLVAFVATLLALIGRRRSSRAAAA
ncbi:MAG: DUF2510 domain-containing protein [Jatrophihabitans sp.]|uniref:DUF2510 domain-containing protein n=1 Tax=Jatrophihabitans sp. TaxID=1932789 RepID=UPI003F7D20F9